MSGRSMCGGFPLSAALVVAFLTACGGGGNGGGPQPAAQATLTGPEVTTGPGERATMTLRLMTNRAAAGVQVDVVSPADVVPAIDAIAPAGRATSLHDAFVQNLAQGRARVVLFDHDGRAAIPAGDGFVLTLSFQTGGNATLGTSPIALENGIVVDEDANEFELTLVPGSVTVVAAGSPAIRP